MADVDFEVLKMDIHYYIDANCPNAGPDII